MKLTILGAGAWGTALASHAAADPRHDVVLWGRDADQLAAIAATGTNATYLAGVTLSSRLAASPISTVPSTMRWPTHRACWSSPRRYRACAR